MTDGAMKTAGRNGFSRMVLALLCMTAVTVPSSAEDAAKGTPAMPDLREMQAVANALKGATKPPFGFPSHTPRPGAHDRADPHLNLPPDKFLLVALQHLAEGRPVEAMKTLNTAIGKCPDHPKLRGVRASLHLEHGRYADALADLEVALKSAPDDPLLLVNRAQAYRGFKRNKEALADLNRAIGKKPGFIGALFNRGALLFEMRKYEEALKDFEKVAALDPHLPAARFNIAMTLDALGKRQQAMKELENFLKVAKHEGWRAVAWKQLNNWRKQAGLPELKPLSATMEIDAPDGRSKETKKGTGGEEQSQ